MPEVFPDGTTYIERIETAAWSIRTSLKNKNRAEMVAIIEGAVETILDCSLKTRSFLQPKE